MGTLNPKFQTLAQRHGLSDPDLKTPAHDQILLWVKANFLKEIVNVVFPANEWDLADVVACVALAERRVAGRIGALEAAIESDRRALAKADESPGGTGTYASRLAERRLPMMTAEVEALRGPLSLGEPPRRENVVSAACRLEVPIQEGAGRFTVGFLDALGEATVPQKLQIAGSDSPAVDMHSSEGGHWVPPSWNPRYENWRFAIEVKTAIPGFGELMRQVNLYRSHVGGVFVVVSPDDRFAAEIAAEGVTFIKYTGELPPVEPAQKSLL